MTSQENYGPIARAVQQYLDHDQWRYQARPNPDNTFVSFASTINLPHLTANSRFDADDEDNRFTVFVYCGVNVPGPARVAVAEFLTRVNYRLYLGKLEMDMDDGEVRATAAVSLEDCPLSQAMIEHMENAAHFALNDAYPAIMAIAYGGKTAVEAFRAYQKKDEANEGEVA